ncbi:MAG TPA: lysoplasmalogenase, partial [Vicinamibacteria bacterium]|nr:lysoplasmalogenase [Vicinamibacteria bacterium]
SEGRTRALIAAAVVGVGAYVVGSRADVPLVRLIAKPAPVLALAILVLSRRRDRYAALIGLGLTLSALGDFLLERPGGFITGLVAFLAAHLAYATAFVFEEKRLRAGRAAPFAAWLITAGLWLRPGLGTLATPVAVYMLAIGTMMWRAAARLDGAETRPGARTALAGAILFGLSDTVLAIDRFRRPLPYAGIAIMALYWAGQAAIACSAAGSSARPTPPREPAPAPAGS